MSKILTEDEIKLAINPLTATSKMSNWAENITSRGTNDTDKARLLFDEIVKRVKQNRADGTGKMRTAKEVFDVWDDPSIQLYCRDYALLYVALSRSVGLAAYDVYVQEQANGSTEPHDCAFLILNGGGILVDPTYLSPGVLHKKFIVLNDLQVIALYLSQLPGIKCSEIAVKLAPELSLVQLNLFEKLLDNGSLDAARKVLPVVERLDTNAVTTCYAEGRLALCEGRTGEAVRLLEEAVTLDSDVAVYHVQLAAANAEMGRLSDTRKALNDALRCPLTVEEAERVRMLLTNTNGLESWIAGLKGVVQDK